MATKKMATKKIFNQLSQEGKKSILSYLDELRQADIEKDIKEDLAHYTPEQREEFLGLVKGKGRGKKRSKEAKVKDPNAPKGVKKAYFFFTGAKLAELKEENKKLTHKEAQKMCGEMWKNFTDEEKKPYLDQEAEDKERYQREMKAYVPPSSEELAKLAKPAKADKKTKTKPAKKNKKAKPEEEDGFSKFQDRILPELRKQNGEISDKDAKKKCKSLWKQLSSEQKALFAEMEEEEVSSSGEEDSDEK